MLRVSRPLLLEALNSTSAAAATSTIRPTQAGSPTSTSSAGTSARQGGRRQQHAQRKPLSERYDIGGHPHPPLNPRYSSLVVGEHFGRIVHDRRAEMMAILSATNLIREVIAGEGHVLLTSTDKRLEAELLAAARDTGEFSHAGKWLPGGFTNRPQVATVPKLPSLVIAFEPDNHILMREAFQMCIPRVAPVNIYKTRADFTPEVPLHATEYTLNEKRRMIAFFASFIAKIKYGQMPVGDTQSRYKEYVDRMRTSYHNQVRDLPDPYQRAARRPFDSRPDLKYGVHPAHVDYNAQRAFEESLNYHRATLQPASYLDDAATEDDIIARDLPPIESYDVGHTVEYSTLTDKYAASIPSDHGTWVKDSEGRNIPELNNRDYEHEELMADLQARREAGIKAEPHWSSTEAAKMQRRGDELEKLSATMPDAELRDQYEAWLKDRQDQANDFIPFDRKTEYDAPSKFSQPSEKQAQDRLWKLKTRVRENQTRKQETEGKKSAAARERRMANKGMPTVTKGMTRMPFLDESFLEDAPTGKRQFSTFARPTAFMARSYSTASAAQAESAAPLTSATSSSSSTSASTSQPQRRRGFVIPRFTLPLFLIVPLFAYFASLYHTDEETLAKVEAEQKEMIEGLKAKLGLQTLQAESSSETPKVDQSKEQFLSSSSNSSLRLLLTADLSTLTTELSQLLEAQSFVLESIPVDRRSAHSIILEELEARRIELEERIRELKNKIQELDHK